MITVHTSLPSPTLNLNTVIIHQRRLKPAWTVITKKYEYKKISRKRPTSHSPCVTVHVHQWPWTTKKFYNQMQLNTKVCTLIINFIKNNKSGNKIKKICKNKRVNSAYDSKITQNFTKKQNHYPYTIELNCTYGLILWCSASQSNPMWKFCGDARLKYFNE